MAKTDEWRRWGERMRRSLKGRKTREQVAEHMDISYSQVGHWQNGTRYPYLDEFFKLCDFLEVDPRHLLFGEMTIDAARDVIDQALSRTEPEQPGRLRVVQTPTEPTDDVRQLPRGGRVRAKRCKKGR